MEEEKQKKELKDTSPDVLTEGFELLDAAAKGRNITVRDDQYDYYWIADAAEMCRKKGFRFRLMDTGRFEKIDLMWLIESGIDLYTDDQTRKDFTELEELARKCKKENSLFTYLHTGTFEKEEESESSVFSGLLTLARSRALIYVSSREVSRELAQIKELALGCQEGGTQLVYYHHGPLDPLFIDIGSKEAWIHICEKSIDKEQRLLLLDICQSASLSGGGLIIHLENPVEYDLVEDLLNKGAYVLFLYAHFDYKSPFRELERIARQRKCDPKAYYLQHDFFL